MKEKLTIKTMQKEAKKHGGRCISKKYRGALVALKWECKHSHTWKSTPCCVRNNGSWCKICAVNSRKSTIEDMQKLAKNKNGECLSVNYIDSNTKLKWKCSIDHIWEAKPNDIVTGYWCPKCAVENRAKNSRLTVKDMQKLAEERNGKCVSIFYTNNSTKLKWECFLGHRWKATPTNIIQGTWCPNCSSGLSERICRAYFETIFQKEFPKKRPKWLLNPKTNYPLELDGYCEELGIAFEHQGEQHYTTKTRFIKTKKDLRKIQTIDRFKIEICNSNNVILIQIPSLNRRLKIKNLENFIIDELIKIKS